MLVWGRQRGPASRASPPSVSISRFTLPDVGLPGIDGFEVTRRSRRSSDTYVIMVSVRNEESDTLTG
jgi:CheY-like chemotaxis protein